jgi:hemoglobin/transferrin/lactoferrin receptor protein
VRFGGASYRSREDSLAANQLTGRAGVVFTPAEPFSVHAQYSRGFRAPNVTDLGTLGLQGNGFYEASAAQLAGRAAWIGSRADDRAVSTGLPVENVRSETSDNYDLGFQVRTGRFRAELTGFWMSLGNTIVSQALILPPGAAGQPLGDQVISRQLASGVVFVPLATSPVLVRANCGGARLRGLEHSLRFRFTRALSLGENLTRLRASDRNTGLPPDIEPGIPPLTVNLTLLYAPPTRRHWVELYGVVADRQDRLSSLALGDRRIGASRSRADIAGFFHNGARVRGLVAAGRLLPTGETLAQVQQRVLGLAESAPLFTAIPGYGALGIRGGFPLGERSDVILDFFNLFDKNYRGVGWGVDAPGRGLAARYRLRF